MLLFAATRKVKCCNRQVAVAILTPSRRGAGIIGAPYPLKDAEIPNADVDNKAFKIDLPIVIHWQPRREFDAFKEKVAWQQSDVKDKLYQYIELELRGHDAAVLRSYQWFLCEAAKHLDIEVARVFDKLPIREHWTTMKSAFIYKKHQVQYEWRTFFKFVQLKHITESTANTYLEYVERNLPDGVAMNVAKLEMCALPEYLQQRPSEKQNEAEPQSDVNADADKNRSS